MYPAKTDPIKTGTYIAHLRKDRNMTQFALAAALQVSHQAVSKWETGNALPDVDMLLAIANLFEVNIDNLLFGSDEIETIMDDDRLLYSETMACAVKTNNDIRLLMEAYEEMREEDITDCIQTLGIRDTDILIKLCTRLSSRKRVQIIKTLHLSQLLPHVTKHMDRDDILECIQYLGITDTAVIKSLMSVE